MEGQLLASYEQDVKEETRTSFQWWLRQISKESFGTLSVAELKVHQNELLTIFKQITTEKDDAVIENKAYDQQRIRSMIRQAFIPIRELKVTEEIVPEEAELLQIEKLTSPVENSEKYYPDQKAVHEIMEWDEKPALQEPSPEVLELIEKLKAIGQDVSGIQLQTDPYPERTQTYHYLPYRFDSRLEEQFFANEIYPLIAGKNLEVYFNGDDMLTEFKISCYTKTSRGWRYIGKYVPDFLLIKRNDERQIDKVIIIETKGEGFTAKFKERKEFMKEWVSKNNEQFGYPRFSFLYLEDTLTSEQRREKTLQAIKDFFNM
jgi:hypothetical protein